MITIILSLLEDTFVYILERQIILLILGIMKKQKLHDINFLLRSVEQYLQTDMSPEIEQTYKTLLNLRMSLSKQ